MQKSGLKALLAVLVMAAVGLLLASAAGRGLPTYGGLSLPLWSLLIAFGVQWLAFIPAYLNHTERFYDLTGALSNIAVVLVCCLLYTSDAADE